MTLQNIVGGVCVAIICLVVVSWWFKMVLRALDGDEEGRFVMGLTVTVLVAAGAIWGIVGWVGWQRT